MRRFSPSRAAVVRTGVVFVAIAAAGPVYAQSSTTAPAARDALARARTAWDDGDFDVAPSLYANALNAGGLSRAEVVEAHARRGAALAVMGKRREALAAFRDAALLDPAFTLPPEAGKKATVLAQRARKEQQRIGSLGVSAQMPDEVTAAEPFGIDVTLAPSNAALVDTVALQVRDKLTARAFEQQSPASAHVHFDVPARMTLPDATLVVRVQARDAHGNELLTDEKRVHVTRPVIAAPVPAALRPMLRKSREDRGTHVASSGGGFWNSAWPYILGGTALAAGGAAAWYFTRPAPDVNVGAARVDVLH